MRAVHLCVGFAVGLGLAACADAKVDALEAIKRDACACKDARCRHDVEAALVAAAAQPTSHLDRAKVLGGEIMACMANIPEAEAVHDP